MRTRCILLLAANSALAITWAQVMTVMLLNNHEVLLLERIPVVLEFEAVLEGI